MARSSRSATTKTRSRKPPAEVELPDEAELERLKLSPEVAWYLLSRGFPLPDCPPLFKTPEPRDVRGARFDPAAVDKVLLVFSLLRHTKGRWAGKPLTPDPWQVAYVLAPVFGWLQWDDESAQYVRIISSLYVELPRKNGKSTLAGGIGIYLTCADGEPGAQVVAAATTKDQAGFVFDPIKVLAEQSPALRSHVRAYGSKIVHTRSGSTFKVVANVGDAQHGADLHGSITDELHLHQSPELVEALETGTGSRRQPLTVLITTADAGKPNTIYDRKRVRIETLASGSLKDPTTYGVIFAAPKGAAPFAEATLRAANPGYGISPTARYLQKAAATAQQSPAELATYERLHLGWRTKQTTRYLTLESWDRNASIVDELALRKRVAYGGLDLSATSDLTALCLVFPDDDGGYDVRWRFWTPEANLEALDKRTAGNASVWRRQGWLDITPGNVVDYDFIEAAVGVDRDRYEIAEIAYDRWNSSQLVNDLTADGAPMVEIGQGFASLSAPLKEVQRLLLLGTEDNPMLRHGGNPVMRWMVDNLAAVMDAAGNVKPDKANSGDKIDGVSALVMAVARAMERTAPSRSIYEDDDLEVG